MRSIVHVELLLLDIMIPPMVYSLLDIENIFLIKG